MFKPTDIDQIIARGSRIETVERQIENFKTGFTSFEITEAASNYHGIIVLSEAEIGKYISVYENKVVQGLSLLKFVPASGAASRMFQSLFAALEDFHKGKEHVEALKHRGVSTFLEEIDQFAFYYDLRQMAAQKNLDIKQVQPQTLLEWVLLEKGLNYGNLPKGLLKFHCYPDGCRTSLEEHFAEGAAYAKDSYSVVNLHFTVSPEHQELFEKLVAEISPKYEELFGAKYQISFSQQKPSTDTIAVTHENEPFRDKDGSLLFRPAGHGALLENLNDLEADLIFIKNIDNVVPDRLRQTTINYKKAIAGVLLSLQEQIFYYQKMLNEHYSSSLESAFYAEAANFLENVLNIKPPHDQYYSEKEELFHYFASKFNRPIRVCGMVKNQGETGGGPFFARNRDGSVSLQIVESSQINPGDTEQMDILHRATHFNPVDIVCAVKNYKGEKYDLHNFTDPETGFISIKSKDGKELKSLELPGLWNGSMSDWNTLFVEVPLETFNPVKTVNDLLRKEHRTE